MAIKDLVVGGIDTAFTVLKELVREVSVQGDTGSYDPATGAATVATTGTVQALFAGTAKRDEGDVKVGDREMFVRTSDGVAIEPEMAIVETSGAKWRVVRAVLDPTNTVYECMVRSTV